MKVLDDRIRTGRTRYRLQRRLFRQPLVVLQVEVKRFVPWELGKFAKGENKTWWIDAMPLDLASIDFGTAPVDIYKCVCGFKSTTYLCRKPFKPGKQLTLCGNPARGGGLCAHSAACHQVKP